MSVIFFSSGRLVCCFNYEEVNGVCIACMDGFMTFDGGQCRPCSRGFYGKDCLIMCHCNMNEKCDHVKGCLKVLHSTTEAVTEHDHVEGTTFSAVEPTTDIHSKRGSSLSALGPTEEIKGKTGIDDSKLPILSIIGISTVLILLVFVSLSWVCWKYKVPCKKRKLEEGPSNTETSFIHAEENKVYFINQNG
ncbi:MEGF10_11 [Mytilus edulis]|uniref:MEGF10_11 n=1 Tax=Mytilus edulis TaxID=6550 RepID=A0A8S3SK00_MYTED|nr:MEGF10_11 [Mytilus edulis]